DADSTSEVEENNNCNGDNVEASNGDCDNDYNSDDNDNNGDNNNIDNSDKNSNTMSPSDTTIFWSPLSAQYQPRLKVSADRTPVILNESINRSSDYLDVWLQIFPRSLLMYIAQCTNIRLDILRREKKINIADTDHSEILLVLGVTLVMCYNRVPNFSDYWSTHSSLGNEAIKNAISRNRCQMLLSKLYFANPDKGESSSKTYYIDDVICCLKKTFQKAREDSPFQSIDESMTKFKGRSSLKQYLPMKPIKRGIKIWERCDSKTGYIYDLDVYSGKDLEEKSDQRRTLGERVVLKLVESVRRSDVTLAFDRFFTSVRLVDTIQYAAVGTCISNRRNMPKFDGKLEKGQYQHMANTSGTIAARWKDSKEVLVLSNCHRANDIQVLRKKKDGSKDNVPCPESIAFYNEIMGGVDLSDQKVGTYDFNRKSQKWWRKVFFKVLMMSVVNSWILYQETKTKRFSYWTVKRKRTSGRPTPASKLMLNVGDHLPVEGNTRRRCVRCSKLKKETRTKTLCTMCKLPLCKNCFAPYHT
ncbi:hypothetical protein ANN_01478, partial [Periplaneta americana]